MACTFRAFVFPDAVDLMIPHDSELLELAIRLRAGGCLPRSEAGASDQDWTGGQASAVKAGFLIRHMRQAGRSVPRLKLISRGRATSESEARHVGGRRGGDNLVSCLSWLLSLVIVVPEAVVNTERRGNKKLRTGRQQNAKGLTCDIRVFQNENRLRVRLRVVSKE